MSACTPLAVRRRWRLERNRGRSRQAMSWRCTTDTEKSRSRRFGMPEAYIIDAVRTPRGIGKVGKGALAHLHPQHLAATVLKALQTRNDINTAEVDDVIWGTSAQKGKQGGDMARMAALDAGFDITTSGVTLDRF